MLNNLNANIKKNNKKDTFIRMYVNIWRTCQLNVKYVLTPS